ncbi:hypothetical protein C0991_008909, partial [Blastosporella zonata]
MESDPLSQAHVYYAEAAGDGRRASGGRRDDGPSRSGDHEGNPKYRNADVFEEAIGQEVSLLRVSDHRSASSERLSGDERRASGGRRGDGPSRSGDHEGNPKYRNADVFEGSNQAIGLEERVSDHRGPSREMYSESLRPVPQEVEVLDQKLEITKANHDYGLKELGYVKKEMDDMKNYLNGELQAKQRRLDEYATRFQRQEQELHILKEKLHRAEAILQPTRQQLVERTTELHSAQSFINQADPLSGAEIISMAVTLNAEILQSAALMADLYTGRRQTPPNELLSGVKVSLGEDMVKALMNQRSLPSNDFDPTLVQLALQVCFVSCCSRIVRSWSLGCDDRILEDLYKKIWNQGQFLQVSVQEHFFTDARYTSEKQSAAGRWRSMARSHAMGIHGADRSSQMLVNEVKQTLVIAGVDYEPLAQFDEKFSRIITLALRLRLAMGQVTSMDIFPFVISPGVAFNPNDMDDMYECERRSEDGKSDLKRGERVAG